MTQAMAKKLAKIAAILIIICVIGFFSSCAYISHKGSSAYEQIVVGDTFQMVLVRFDMPYATQPADSGFPGYTAEGCKPRCANRIWFVNKWSLAGEAWSIDFDGSGHVVGKFHWMSP